MTISKIRTYLKNMVTIVDSTMKEWTNPFSNVDLPEPMVNNAYWIKYDVVSTVDSQAYFTDTINVQMQFYFKSFNDQLADYDSAMDKVNNIKREAVSAANIEAFKSTDSYPIIRVNSVSQTGEEFADNTKRIIIELNLEMDIIQTSC